MFSGFRIKDLPISLQLVVLWCIALLNSAIFWSIGSLICWMLWEVNPFNDPTALMDVSNINVVYSTRVMMVFQNLGMFLVPALIFADISKYGGKFLDIQRAAGIYYLLCAVLVVVALPMVDRIVVFNESIELPAWLGREVLDSMENDAQETAQAILGGHSSQGIWLNMLLLAVVPALGEELFFRGALLQLMRRSKLGWHGAIWVSAFIFSIIHLQFYGAIPRLFLGALFGYMVYWTGSIWIPILAHFIHNGLYVLLWHSPQLNEAGGGIWWPVGSLLISIGLLVLFYRQSKRGREQVLE